MSLFHELLKLKPVREAALEGRGFFATPSMLLRALRPQDKAVDAGEPPLRWTIVNGALIDLDLLGKTHPGGAAILTAAESGDATELFHSVHVLSNEKQMAHYLESVSVGDAKDFCRDAGVAAALAKPAGKISLLGEELRGFVRGYFTELAEKRVCTPRQAAKATAGKRALVVALWAMFSVAFACWLRGSASALLLMPFFGAMATFHSFHDASHGAFSSRPWLNEALTYSGFLIAAPHEWRWQHIALHHVHTNVAGLDPDSKHANRWVKETPPPRITVPLVWAIAVPLGLQARQTVRYLRDWVSRTPAPVPLPTPSVGSLLAVVVHRFVFWGLPLLLFGVGWGIVFAAVPSVVFSMLFMLNTQLAHLNALTGGEQEEAFECWYEGQARTTMDIAPLSTLHWLLSGGLNCQLEHHLFPSVDHCHLPALQKGVKAICEAHAVPYLQVSGYLQGLCSHMQFLYGPKLEGVESCMESSSALYTGRVWHRRRACKGSRHSKADHNLTYDVEYTLLDLDEVEKHGAVPDVSGLLFSYKSSWPAPLSFHPEDHLRSLGGRKSAGSLADAVREWVAKKMEEQGRSPVQMGSVRLFSMPRRLGYVFNPLSVYYVYNEAGTDVVATVLEVSNTPWNEEHLYLLPKPSSGVAEKAFHVSPFQPMDTVMEWNAPMPGDDLSLSCKISKHGEPFFEATVHLSRKELSTATAARALVAAPLRTYGVQWAIHVEAWHLFRKGCTFYSNPRGTKTAFSRGVELIFHNRRAIACWLCVAVLAAILSGKRAVLLSALLAGAARLVPRTCAGGSSPEGGGEAPKDAPASGKPSGKEAPEDGSNEDSGSVEVTQKGAGAAQGAKEGSRKKVCVIGSGIAGHGAAYFLRESCEVTLVERDDRTGGHAHTATVADNMNVDVGFQVFNYANYPLLTRLFDELGVATVESNMSLSVASRGVGDDFEWASVSLFPTWLSFFSPRNWLRVRNILSFESAARKALATKEGLGDDVTLQKWLAAAGLPASLADEYLVPMSAALWSCPSKDVLTFPAVTVLGFLDNHFMLQRARPKWRTPKGRSKDYVAKLRERLLAAGAKVQTSCEVASLQSSDGGIQVIDVQGRPVLPQPCDQVVLAVHADQAAAIVRRSQLPKKDMDQVETVLGNFRYASSLVQVHSDPKLMPVARSCWSAWNAVRLPSDVCAVTYWINKLQPGSVPAGGGDVFVTLNAPEGSVKASSELARFQLEHPVLDAAALKAQKKLPSLQGLAGGRLFFCGAWAGHGFHEDGLRSAHAACTAMGVDVSGWRVERHELAAPSLPARLLCSYALEPGLQKMVRKGSLRVVLPDGSELVAGDGTGKEVEVRIRAERVLWHAMLDPGMGLADGYEEGEIEIFPDVLDFLELVLANKPKGDDASSPLAWSPVQGVTHLAKQYYALLHKRRANTLKGSKANIEAHYDLSNAMFEKFLSKDMTYSAGIFDAEVETVEKEKGAKDFLEVAQYKKLDRMADVINLQDGDTVLEIGCGWGSMAIRALQRFPGVKRWVGLTLSTQQLELAKGRIEAAGLSDKIEIVLLDYRDAASKYGPGYFSKVVSIEMIEAVGHEFLPGYFAAIDECLKPGGLASIQAICVPDGRYESYRKGSDFIRERIFPGSNLVSLGEVKRACEVGQTSLTFHGEPFSVGISYAKTLHEWRVRFGAHEAAIRKEVSTFGEGFDDRFLRRWHYYFAYCEAGFAMGHIDDWQICLRKDPTSETGSTAKRRSAASFNGDALHASNAKLVPEGFLNKPKKALMSVAVNASQRLLDRGLMPDWAVRFGIRLKLRQKINEESHGNVELDQAAKLDFIESLKQMPIAICTQEANEQHYEVPAELYHLWLGPRKKYSGCIYPDDAHPRQTARAGELLPEAEERSLEQYVVRAEVENGMAILDLGCGWGSLSLFLAKKLPKSLVVGVSNSHGQREWIMARAKERDITNLRIVTIDVSKVPLAEAALPVLQAERPGAVGFDRVMSVEMMEHMKNYDILLERVSAVLRPGGKMFVHIFVHTRFAYHFVARTEADWMARYFFAGGTMPSADLLFYFQRNLRLLKHWHVNGRHYQLTAEGWLQNTDKHATRIMELLRETYPAGTEVMWFNRWRAFFMACAELWGFDGGNEWIVAHYLFEKP